MAHVWMKHYGDDKKKWIVRNGKFMIRDGFEFTTTQNMSQAQIDYDAGTILFQSLGSYKIVLWESRYAKISLDLKEQYDYIHLDISATGSLSTQLTGDWTPFSCFLGLQFNNFSGVPKPSSTNWVSNMNTGVIAGTGNASNLTRHNINNSVLNLKGDFSYAHASPKNKIIFGAETRVTTESYYDGATIKNFKFLLSINNLYLYNK